MDRYRIGGFSDDSTINAVGSLFRRIDGSIWYININTSPAKSKHSYLTLSQAPIIARQRVLNPQTKVNPKSYYKSFTIKNTHDWQIAQVKDCNVIKYHRSVDNEQYCFVFQTVDGMTVHLPQFELARALFFHDGYLSRTAMTPDILQNEFNIKVDKKQNIALIDVMTSCTYKVNYFNEPDCRRVLTWILMNKDVRRSYESIGKFQLLEGKNVGQYRIWNFRFSPPVLANTHFSVKGWFNSDLNSIFVHEIEAFHRIPTELPEKVFFSHPDFNRYISGKGRGGYGTGGERPLEHNIDDEASANVDNNTVIIKPHSVVMSFDKSVQTIRIARKDKMNGYGKQNDDAPETASKDVSTDEATTVGELPNADWDNIDDQTDDSHLYLSKFHSFFKMLELLESLHGCSVNKYPLRKLPKLVRCKKHLLDHDGSPRCLSVVHIETSDTGYFILEVDTSDNNKSLSTKVINDCAIENIEYFVEDIERRLLKASLSWPKDYLDSVVGENNHFGVSHQKSDKSGNLLKEDIYKWSERFYFKLS